MLSTGRYGTKRRTLLTTLPVLLLILAGMLFILPGIARADGVVSDCSNFSAPNGLGAALNQGGKITFTCDGTITISSAISISSGASVTIDGSNHTITLKNNSNVKFFVIGNNSTVTLIHITLDGAGNSNGSMVQNSGTFTADLSTFTNSSTSQNSLINNNGTMTLNRSTFTGLKTNNGNIVSSSGSLNITNSTFYANKTVYDGNATVFVSAGTTNITNSTFNGNTNHEGALVMASGNKSPTVNILNTTISGNSLEDNDDHNEAAVLKKAGVINLGNSIIANTSYGKNCIGITSKGNNISNDGTCGDGSPGSDPKLDPTGLKDNGGPTLTLALTGTSPAIDTANSATCPATDQRGLGRMNTCDIGAYEYGAKRPVVITWANPASIVYGTPLSTTQLNATAPVAGTFAYTPSAGIVLDAGTQTLSVTFTPDDSTNYATTTKSVTLNVAKAPLTVKANDANRLFGLQNPTFSGSLNVVVNNDNITANYATTATVSSGVGTYAITPALIDPNNRLGNYTVTSINGTLTITQASSTLTLSSSKDREYYYENVTLTAILDQIYATGTVTFTDNFSPTLSVTGTVVNGQAAVTVNLPDGGIHNITAEYAGDSNVTGSKSTNLSLEIIDGWAAAREISLSGDSNTISGNATWTNASSKGGVWYKIPIPANSKISVTLKGVDGNDLPYDMDITLHKNVQQEYNALNSANSAGASTATQLYQQAKTTTMQSTQMWTWQMWTFPMWTWQMWTFPMWTWQMWTFPPPTTDMAFQPDENVPSGYAPDSAKRYNFSPVAPVPYVSAQRTSLEQASIQTGTVPEYLVSQSGNESGYYYIRVKNKSNGTSPSQAKPFEVDVKVENLSCLGFTPPTDIPTYTNSHADTVIVTDYSVLPPGAAATTTTPSELDQLKAKLVTFQNDPRVKGVVVDLSSNNRVAAARSAAKASINCPQAQNALASEIKAVVSSYTPKYIVLMGDDNVIPFYRYKDLAAISRESEYVPPVYPDKAAGVALRNDYILGQDFYGQTGVFDPGLVEVPIPGAPVGRLVSNAGDILNMVTAFLNANNVVDSNNNRMNGVIKPQTALVTGYDFISTASNLIKDDLAIGINGPVDTLIVTDTTKVTPWTADQLRAQFINKQHDLVFLGGHFSAGATETADGNIITAAELLASSTLQTNSLLWSIGCHSGYNIPTDANITGFSPSPDWSQAFAKKGITSITGTGFQYGDTDVLAYSELLYSDFSRYLHPAGSSIVNVGDALVATKKHYLSSNTPLQGVHAKVLIEATLYGFPMMGVQMTPNALTPDSPVNLGASLQDIGSLSVYSYTVDPLTTKRNDITLSNNVVTTTKQTATYFTGQNGATTNPLEPIQPLQNVTLPASISGKTVRGALFLSGSYQDFHDPGGIFPLVGTSPTTNQSLAHPVFNSTYFYPASIQNLNYMDALGGGNSVTLALTPSQFKSDDASSTVGTMRVYSSASYRLYYSNSGGVDSAPIITVNKISSVATGISVTAQVIGQPGVQEVWITYTDGTGSWTSKLMNKLSGNDWDQDIPANSQFFLQAVSTNGLVAVSNNGGANYNSSSLATRTPTVVTISNLPTLGIDPATGKVFVYTQQTLSSQLQATLFYNDGSGNKPLTGKRIIFNLGGQYISALTDASGVAIVDPASSNFFVNQVPGIYYYNAYFPGDDTYGPASSPSQQFVILKQPTNLSLTAPSSVTYGTPGNSIVATLVDSQGKPVQQKPVVFRITSTTSPGTTFAKAVNTGTDGKAILGPTFWPVGTYILSASFAADNPDVFYASSTATPSLNLAITSAPLVVKPADASKVYGQPLPGSFALIYTGLVPGDTPAFLNGQISVTTTVTQNSAPGNYPITASGPSPFGNYTITYQQGTFTVTQAQSAITVSYVQGSSFRGPVPVTFTVTVNPVSPGTGTPTGQVSIQNGSTVLKTGDLISGTVQIVVNLNSGSYNLNISYAGDGNFKASTTSTQVTVTKYSNNTKTSLTSSVNPSALNQPVTFVATVKAYNSTLLQPGGTVKFLDGSTTLATVNLTSGKASLTIATLALGSHKITAIYSGDSNFQGSLDQLTQYVGNKGCLEPDDDSDHDYDYDGQCRNNYPTVKKAGSTLPIKIQLRDFNNALVSGPDVIVTAIAVDATPITANNTFKYEASGKRYRYNLKTTDLQPGAHILYFKVSTDPNTVYQIGFTLK